MRLLLEAPPETTPAPPERHVSPEAQAPPESHALALPCAVPVQRGRRRWMALAALFALATAGALGFAWQVKQSSERRQAELASRLAAQAAEQRLQLEKMEKMEALLAQIAANTAPAPPESIAPVAPPVPAPAGRAKAEKPAKPEQAENPAAGPPDESRKKGKLARFFTSSLFVDSAVLTGSVLVPPALPLSLMQSRLGRRVTAKVLKKTDSDKTMAGRVVRDVGDMPITQRRRR